MARASWLVVGIALAVVGCAAGADEDSSSLGEDSGAGAPDATTTGADGASNDDGSTSTPGSDGASPANEDTGAPPTEDSSAPGDDGASDDGSDQDSSEPLDSGQDSSTADAGHDSGSVEDAGHDSGTDAGLDSAAPDAAIDDAGCTATSPTFTPTYFPPATASGPCNSTQIQDFYDDCLAGSASACNTWTSANASCSTCLQGNTAPTGPDWGPFTIWPLASTETIVELNIGGCLVDDGRSLSCAKAFEDLTECEHSACGASCYGDSFGNYQTCQTAADKDQCLTYYNDVYVNASPCSNSTFEDTCLANWTTFEGGFLAIAGVMCD